MKRINLLDYLKAQMTIPNGMLVKSSLIDKLEIFGFQNGTGPENFPNNICELAIQTAGSVILNNVISINSGFLKTDMAMSRVFRKISLLFTDCQ